MLTRSDGAATRQKLRAELQAELARHRRAILDIKSRHNSLQPITHLPNEILLEVFQYHRDVQIYNRVPCMDLWWVNITRVCHHWREVAMECPHLWAHLDFTPNRRRVSELLARSKEVELDVQAHSDLWLWEDSLPRSIMRTLEKALCRAQSIDLQMESDICDAMEEHIPRTLPQLKTIILQRPHDEGELLPTLFDDCDLPSLEDVWISCYRVEWSSNIFTPTLTHLEVHCNYRSSACPYLDILDGLSNLPVLESLVLVNCMKRELLVEASQAGPQVTLSRLKYLDLTGELFACSSILDCLSVQYSTRVSLTLEDAGDGMEILPLLQCISNSVASKLRANGPNTVPARSFEVKGYDGHYELFFWRDTYSVEDLARGSRNSADYYVSVDTTSRGGSWATPEMIVEFVCTTLPLQGVETFSVMGFLPQKSSLEILLALLPSVSAVRMDDGLIMDDLINILSALQLSQPCATDNDHRHTYLVPRLRTIQLEHVNFTWWLPKDTDDEDIFRNIRPALTARKDANEGVSKFILKDCTEVYRHDILQLESIVEVVWEGSDGNIGPPGFNDSEEGDQEQEEDLEGREEDSGVGVKEDGLEKEDEEDEVVSEEDEEVDSEEDKDDDEDNDEDEEEGYCQTCGQPFYL